MDGSNFRPQHEEPHDYHVENGDDHPLVLLAFLLAVVASTFFFTYRHQLLDWAGCLSGSGQNCGAAAPQQPPSTGRPQ